MRPTNKHLNPKQLLRLKNPIW